MSYIYAAAYYCDACGEQLREDIIANGHKPEDVDDETTYDSDDFPKGPYPHDLQYGWERCDGCHVFLENNLTAEAEQRNLANKNAPHCGPEQDPESGDGQ